jgi:hypothetical protein
MATGCFKVPIQLQNTRTALQTCRQYGCVLFKQAFCFIILVTVLAVTVLYMPHSFLVIWNWNEDEPQQTHTKLSFSVFCIFVTLYENMCSYFFHIYYLKWNCIFTYYLYMYIQVRLPFLNSAVWTGWQRMVFPKIFFCLCGLFCISIPRQNPELKQIC